MRDSSRQESRFDHLAEMARADAVRGAPRFSGALHARVMTAVRSASRSPDSASLRALNPWAVVSAAAALALIFTAPRLHSISSRGVATVPARGISHRAEDLVLTTPPVRATLASWGRQESALEADLGPTQLAGLDHDARVAARYVLDPLSLPTHRR